MTIFKRQYLVQRSKEKIVKFIAELENRGLKISKQDIIEHMESEKVQKDIRTSRVTTLNLIKELESEGRIKVNKEGWRSGQPQYLVINDKNRFDWISQQIENIGLFYKEHPDYPDRALNLLLMNLARVHKDIKNENDRFILNEKIINSLLRIRYKKDDDDLISTV